MRPGRTTTTARILLRLGTLGAGGLALGVILGLALLHPAWSGAFRPAGEPAPATIELPAAIEVPIRAPAAHDAAPLPEREGIDPLQAEAALRAAPRPAADRYRLTEQVRLRTRTPVPRVVNAEPPDYPVGHRQLFWIHDDDAEHYFQIEAELVYKTEHAYFYFQADRLPDPAAVQASAERFEARIRPTNRRLFGSESTPGVDNDPRITVLTARVPGVGGYYSAADEYPRAVNPYSNERRIIYMNRDVARPGTRAFEATIAHEYQHMIHFNEHPADVSWVKEGLAQLAEKLNGYGVGGVQQRFLAQPNLQLNTWAGGAERAPHYGAAFLFLDNLFTHYGGYEAIPLYVRGPRSSRAGIDDYLQAVGSERRFDDVFADWTVANLINDPTLADGRYGYLGGNTATVSRIERLRDETRAEVRQYGALYYEIEPRGDVEVAFSGETTVAMLPTQPVSGKRMWWSNRGDGMDTTLTRRLDLRGTDHASLDVSLWWDLEDGWDYAYIMVSADDGATWTTLTGRHTTTDDPHGGNLGHGYTGRSGGGPAPRWVREHLDLTPFAGREVLLRFESVTDSSVNEPGFAWDDLSVPEIGLYDDAEDAGEWDASGWVRLGNALPQRYFVHLVTRGPGGTEVRALPLDASNAGTGIVRGLGAAVTRAWVVVAAGAERTTQPAPFTLRLRPLP